MRIIYNLINLHLIKLLIYCILTIIFVRLWKKKLTPILLRYKTRFKLLIIVIYLSLRYEKKCFIFSHFHGIFQFET